MRSQRNLIRDRAVMLAKSGAPPERAITQAIWEHRRPGRWYDAEDEMRFVLECRAAIERALNPAIVRLDPPRQPGVLPNPPAAGFSIDGLPLKAQPPIATDGLIRGLMDAPRHKIGVQLPRQLPKPCSGPCGLLSPSARPSFGVAMPSPLAPRP